LEEQGNPGWRRYSYCLPRKPEPFLNGARGIGQVATDGVVKPVVSGVVTVLNVFLGVIGLLVCGGSALAYKYGLPKPEQVKRAFELLKR
jgi:hypothetical protein